MDRPQEGASGVVRGWTARRTGARRAVAGSLAALIAVTAFLLAGIAGYGSRVGTVGLRDYLRAADATAASVQVQTRLAPDPAAQQRAADSLFGTLFAGLHVSVYRSVTVPPVPITATSATPDAAPAGNPTIRLADFDGLRQHAHLVAGAWPDLAAGSAEPGTRQPAALQQDAARVLHLSVGDTLSIGNSDRVTFAIAAIWAPDRPGDAYFAADAAGARGATALAADQAAAGFIAVPPSVLAAKGAAALVNWTIVPDTDHLVPSEMPAMSTAVAAVPDAVTASRTAAPQGAVSAGGLAGTLRTVTSSVTAAQAVSPVPSLLVAAISLLMLIQLARLLAVERRGETALIRSRGASAGQLTRIALGEATLIGVPAAAVGAGIAVGVLAPAGAGVPLTGWVQAALVAAVAVVTITLPAAHQARLPANRQQIDDSGRIRALAATSTVLLVVIAAGIALWRFRRTGSALVVAPDGTARIDPIAVLAPPLVLIAAALLAGVVFGALAALVEALAARFRGLGAALATRQVARRGTVFGSVVILVAIAIGGVGVAATYSPTQSVAQAQTDILAGGAPLLVRLPAVDPVRAQPYRPPLAAASSALPAVGNAVTALHQPITLGRLDASLIGVSASRVSSVVPAASGSFEPDRLAGVLAGHRAAVRLPDGTTAVTLALSVAAAWAIPGAVTSQSDGSQTQAPGGPGPSGVTVPMGVTLWLQAPDGALSPVGTDGIGAVSVAPSGAGTPQHARLVAPLPHLEPGTRLAGVDLEVPAEQFPMSIALTLSGMTARTATGDRAVPLESGRWVTGPQPEGSNDMLQQLVAYRLTAASLGVGLVGTVPAGQITTARLTPVGPAQLPIAVNRTLADRLKITTGQSLTVALDSGRTFPARVVAISPLLPGSADTPTVLADLPALELMLLRSTPDLPAATELWAAPTEPSAAAAALRPLVPATSTISLTDTRSARALTAPISLTLWFGAVGALLLAAIGVGSVIASLSLSRRGELVVLRSVGVTARRQARSRRRELLTTTVTGWILGVAVAAAAVLTTVTGLAGSAVVGSLGVTPTLHVGWRLTGIMLGAHVALVIAIIAVHAARLRRRVLRSTPSELAI